MTLAGLVLMQSPRIAQQWERAVVLRLGRFVGLRGPGLFWIVPFIERIFADGGYQGKLTAEEVQQQAGIPLDRAIWKNTLKIAKDLGVEAPRL